MNTISIGGELLAELQPGSTVDKVDGRGRPRTIEPRDKVMARAGDLIRKHRLRRGLTQAAAAEATRGVVSAKCWNVIECGHAAGLSCHQLHAIAVVLGVKGTVLAHAAGL